MRTPYLYLIFFSCKRGVVRTDIENKAMYWKFTYCYSIRHKCLLTITGDSASLHLILAFRPLSRAY